MNEIDWSWMNPVAMWRDWFVRSEAQWSEHVSTLLRNEQAGGLLNRQLGELQMMHRQFGEMAQAALAAANLPSRTDLEALDERMGRIEDGLAQLAATVSTLREAVEAAGAAVPTTPRPTRNRRAPAAAAAATVRVGR
jgi:hypothetical protein